jgi:hypothetical protein
MRECAGNEPTVTLSKTNNNLQKDKRKEKENKVPDSGKGDRSGLDDIDSKEQQATEEREKHRRKGFSGPVKTNFG